MPNMTSLYEQARTTRLSSYEDYPVPEEDFSFEMRVDTESRRVSAVINVRNFGKDHQLHLLQLLNDVHS